MLLIVEGKIRGKTFHSVNRCAYANNKHMNDFDKSKESSYVKYSNANDLYGWAMSQKLPVNGFTWFEDLSEFDEGFKKSYNKKVKKDIFWRSIFNIVKI